MIASVLGLMAPLQHAYGFSLVPLLSAPTNFFPTVGSSSTSEWQQSICQGTACPGLDPSGATSSSKDNGGTQTSTWELKDTGKIIDRKTPCDGTACGQQTNPSTEIKSKIRDIPSAPSKRCERFIHAAKKGTKRTNRRMATCLGRKSQSSQSSWQYNTSHEPRGGESYIFSPDPEGGSSSSQSPTPLP